jgi:hypothetical protein
MRTWGQFILLLALCAGAWLLSATQAWALAAPCATPASVYPRLGAHHARPGAAGLAPFGWGSRINPLPGDVAWAILVLAALTAAVALWVASKLGAFAALQGATLVSRAWRLFPIHVLMLGVLGMLDVFVLYAIGLGRIH